MKTLLSVIASCFILVLSIVSCSDADSYHIGSSLITDSIGVVVDSSFTITGSTLENSVVQSRTTRQLLGVIDANKYGYLRSDVVCQFMPAYALDTTYVTAERIDSLLLIMQFSTNSGWTGDSLAPLGLTVYALNRQISSPIFSNFDPTDYYNKNDVLGQAIYTASAIHQSDTVQALNYRQVQVKLPIELARKFFNEYKKNPTTYASPKNFSEFFPGVYMKSTFGSGRITNFDATVLRMYYHKTYHDTDKDRDTTLYMASNYFAVTPEIVSDNMLHLEISDVVKEMKDKGDVLLLAPAGYEVKLNFPGRQIVESFRKNPATRKVLNTLTMTLPVDQIDNEYGIDAPPSVLLVLAKDKEEFFKKNSLNNDKTSFLANYNATAGTYTFSMRNYIQYLLDKDEITDEDTTFILTPVTVNKESDSDYSSSQANNYYYYYYYGGYTSKEYTSSIVPYVENPVMAKLMLEKARITMTFSTQTIEF